MDMINFFIWYLYASVGICFASVVMYKSFKKLKDYGITADDTSPFTTLKIIFIVLLISALWPVTIIVTLLHLLIMGKDK